MAAGDDTGSLKELKDTIESLGSPIDKIIDAIGSMYNEANDLNHAFLEGRVRMDEMADAVSKSAAGVIRLGGSITDVGTTMQNIAAGARRNVIATEEQVKKLFAASSVLGTSSETLVNNFAEVGYETSQIGVNLEGSIQYIQSLGLNAKDVMGDVNTNMKNMNKYNFADGVVGLAKMAAQASMLRFDMADTFSFAEKVLNPEGAINTAAALQRLGLAVGQLGDPFALMNDAINDPGALQDSLIKATKQFVQFDDKTKSFKINPQGMLTLREMAAETGISYDNLAKSALAAVDLDKRLSFINPALNFDKPEDKELLANMATMGEGGEYIVQLKNDKTGEVDKIKLSEITNEELKALRKQQDEKPKTLEEIQISQLDVLKNIQAAIEGTAAKGTYGVAGASVVRGNIVGAERITNALTNSVDKNVPESAVITEKINDAVDKMSGLFVAKDAGKLTDAEFTQKLETLQSTIVNDANSLGEKGIEAFKNILSDANKKVTGSSGIEKEFKKFASEILTATGAPLSEADKAKIKIKDKEPNKTIDDKTLGLSDVFGNKTKQIQENLNNKGSSSQNLNTNSKVDFGEFKITIQTPPGTTLTQQQLNDIFNNDKFKQYVVNLTKQNSSENKGSGVLSY
jgi:hypothetical protein